MSSSAVTAAAETVKSAVNTVMGVGRSASPTQDDSKDETPGISPADQDAKRKLSRQLSNRPDRSELVDKNILKNPNVAPSLQAAQAELARAQLEDQLEAKLQHRPRPEELVKEGILNADEVPK